MKNLHRLQNLALFAFCFLINYEAGPLNITSSFTLARAAGLIYLLTLLPELRAFLATADIKLTLLPVWLFFGLLTTMSFININSVSDTFLDSSIFQGILLFWFLVNHGRRDKTVLEKGMLSFAVGTVVAAVLYAAGIGIEYVHGRVQFFGLNSNELGIQICVSLIVFLVFVSQDRLKLGLMRFALLLPVPLLLKFLADTGSRVAVISLALAFVTGVVLIKTRRIISKVAVTAAAIPISLLIWFSVIQSESVLARLAQSYAKGDLSGRDRIWSALLPLVSQNPIFGVGETGYALFMQSVSGTDLSPHNVLLEVLCYTGIVGLLLYLSFIARVVWASRQRYKWDGALLSLLTLIPMFGLLVSGQILLKKIGWLIFALAVSGSLLTKNQGLSLFSRRTRKPLDFGQSAFQDGPALSDYFVVRESGSRSGGERTRSDNT